MILGVQMYFIRAIKFELPNRKDTQSGVFFVGILCGESNLRACEPLADAGRRARPPPVADAGSVQVVPQQGERSRRQCGELEPLLQTDAGLSPT